MGEWEPKIQFVKAQPETTDAPTGTGTETGSFCSDWATQDPTGGGQRCIGSQIDAHPCEDWDSMIPW